MASRQVFLKDLKVADLKRELEERECETTGKKADLQNRLKEALENEVGSRSKMDGKFGEIENKLVTVEEEFQNKFLEVERKIATLSLGSGEQQRMINTTLKSPGSDIDRMTNPQASSHMEMSKIRMKPPQFDGKSSWVNYLRQFEAAAKANGWSLAEKATALTLRYAAMQRIYCRRFLLKNKRITTNLSDTWKCDMKSNESLQEFEADIARLVRLAYSSTPENVMERLAVQAFLDGLRDTETRQALTLARPSKLVDALARALEFEAAKQSCRGQATVRRVEEGVEEGTCNEAEIRRVVEGMLEKRQIRCWNCDQILLEQQQELLDQLATLHVLQLEIPLLFAVRPTSQLSLETNIKGFELDFKNNVLKIKWRGNRTTSKDGGKQLSCPGRGYGSARTKSHDGEVARGIAVGKALLLTEKTVPVRIMNPQSSPSESKERDCFRVLFFGFLRHSKVRYSSKFSWEDYRRVIKPPVVFLKILEK
ncbi:hypothetical protein NQ318_014850 [Aromia moschata]|uniref:SAP domain-containing protein n=1 Tax=Aromia moschata TaxID=1265417 RepID=A0AAV8XD58_9CUCU|nr:hypothetical protein NQ318_014850 [Aromia moschata]